MQVRTGTPATVGRLNVKERGLLEEIGIEQNIEWWHNIHVNKKIVWNNLDWISLV
jgi:hypothetical protein